MQISSVDFNSMMAELFEYDTPKFDSMCKIARDQLTPLVTKWCVTNPSLRDKGLEDEIIQKTSVRLIRYSLDKFFFAGGREEPNNDPEPDWESYNYLEIHRVDFWGDKVLVTVAAWDYNFNDYEILFYTYTKEGLYQCIEDGNKCYSLRFGDHL